MIRSGPDRLAEPYIGDKTKIPVGGAVSAILRIQEHLQHRHKVSGNFASMFATPLACFGETIAQIRRLCDMQHTRTDMAASAIDQEIRLDRQRNASDNQRCKSIRRPTEGQWSYARKLVTA